MPWDRLGWVVVVGDGLRRVGISRILLAGLGDLIVTKEEVVLALCSWWRLLFLNEPSAALA